MALSDREILFLHLIKLIILLLLLSTRVSLYDSKMGSKHEYVTQKKQKQKKCVSGVNISYSVVVIQLNSDLRLETICYQCLELWLSVF